MATIKNLKPFKKGQSGNPAGRPKLPDLSEAMAKALGGDDAGRTHLERILDVLREKALTGDVRAAQLLLDRGFGQAKQSIDHTSLGERITPPIVWSDQVTP